jgi:glycosyltransferase involved in cell wall biosynthesis
VTRLGVDATHVSASGKGHALSQRQAAHGLARLGYDVVSLVRPEGVGLLETETYVLRSPKTILWELAELPLVGRRLGLDAVLTFSERLPVAGGGPYVVWLFELPTHRIAQNRTTGASAYQRASDAVTGAVWKRGLARARRIATGSQATADELAREAPALAARTSVVHPALRPGFSPGPGPDGEAPYVFHLSSADPRDRTESVLDAFARLRPAGARLVVGGGLGPRGPVLEQRARELGVDATFTGRLSDADLLARYRGALAYVDASLYEGFGYQVLEAMACGAPVVASSLTSIPEVVADAGLLADPREPDAIAGQLGRVLADVDLAASLRERGLARVGAFSWDRTARGLAEAIEAAVG